MRGVLQGKLVTPGWINATGMFWLNSYKDLEGHILDSLQYLRNYIHLYIDKNSPYIYSYNISIRISFKDVAAQRDLSLVAPGGFATLTLSWARRLQSWLCLQCPKHQSLLCLQCQSHQRQETTTTTMEEELSTSLELILRLSPEMKGKCVSTAMETKGSCEKSLIQKY